MLKGATILSARVIYAMSWFFLSPIIPLLEAYYHSALPGLLPEAFFTSAAVMQIPSGLLSSRIGMKYTFTAGLVVMGISDMAIGLSPSPVIQLLSYGLTGFGASMFFSSAGGVLAHLNQGRSTTIMGIYNAMFSLGGILGLLWGSVDQVIGWRLGTSLIGILTLVMGIINYVMRDVPNLYPEIRVTLRPDVALLAVSTSGVWGVYYVVSEYLPTFKHIQTSASPILVGDITTLLLFTSAVGGIISYAFQGKSSKFILPFSLVSVFSVFLMYSALYFIPLLILGVTDELVISLIYGEVVDMVGSENSSIALAVTNAIQIGIGTVVMFFSSIDFRQIWAVAGAMSLILLLVYPLYIRVSSSRISPSTP